MLAFIGDQTGNKLVTEYLDRSLDWTNNSAKSSSKIPGHGLSGDLPRAVLKVRSIAVVTPDNYVL